jgi:hypothetical protein
MGLEFAAGTAEEPPERRRAPSPVAGIAPAAPPAAVQSGSAALGTAMELRGARVMERHGERRRSSTGADRRSFLGARRWHSGGAVVSVSRDCLVDKERRGRGDKNLGGPTYRWTRVAR